MKKYFLFFILSICLINNTFAASVSVSKMQQAISGVIQSKAVKRGFAANDPRYSATLDLVSSTAGGIAGTSAAAIVAGAITAPAWATVAIAIGVGAVVGVGVTLAINGTVDWLFSPNPSDTTPITQHFNQSQPVGNGLSVGASYWSSSILSIKGSDAIAVLTTAISLNWPDDATSHYAMGTCQDLTAPVRKSCLVDRINKTTNYNQKGYAAIGATYVASGAPANCAAGFVYYNSSCVPVPANNADAKLSAQAAINNLPPDELAKPLSPSIVAPVADKLWRDAASKVGYAGLPYNAADPITAADAEAVRAANPQNWPTVQDFVDPQPATNSPWTLPANSAATTQDPAAGNAVGTNPASANPLQNLGVDPGIGSPTLEPTPTAQQILQPLLNLFPDFRSFVTPSHQAVCPKPVFNVFGKSLTMDAQCTIAENQRTSLYAIMAAVWLICAAIIILRA